ncbi:hypothetical protein [Porphyromonas cangingivalis]|nr:hypothetical protein [Porphyromonas cangingivalis]
MTDNTDRRVEGDISSPYLTQVDTSPSSCTTASTLTCRAEDVQAGRRIGI